MKKNLFALACICALTLGLAGQGNAAGFYDDGPRDYPGYGVNLTPEQQQQVQKIFTDNYASMEGTRQALSAKRAELDALLATPNADRSRIESLSREIGELRGKMLSARADLRSQLAKNGLPSDFYAPGPRRDRPARDYYGPDQRYYHHGRGHHRGWDMMGRGMMRGCYGGCWY